MTTHTPGPWWMAAASSGSTGYAVGAGDDELFVSLPRPNPGEERANALLARAAPDTTAALRNLLAEIKTTEAGIALVSPLAIEHAEHALAKAEGRR